MFCCADEHLKSNNTELRDKSIRNYWDESLGGKKEKTVLKLITFNSKRSLASYLSSEGISGGKLSNHDLLAYLSERGNYGLREESKGAKRC